MAALPRHSAGLPSRTVFLNIVTVCVCGRILSAATRVGVYKEYEMQY